MKSQTRLVIDSEHCANALLRAGPPLSEYNTPITGVTTPMGLVSLGKSVFEVILGDWGLGWYSLLVAGASGIFIVIAPGSTAVFENAIIMAFGNKSYTCSQFLRHHGIFPSLSFLRRHNIEFSLMQQRVGEVAIIFPGTYCYGIETGTNYSENISWATDDWDPTQVEYEICNNKCGAGDVLKRPEKRCCSQQSSVQRTIADIPEMVAASREISNLGPEAVSSSQSSDVEQMCETNQEATSSEEFEFGERSKRRRITNHSSGSPPIERQIEREVSRTPGSTSVLRRRRHRILTNDMPTTFTHECNLELWSDDELHKRFEEYLDRSERDGSTKLKEPKYRIF
ncbi:transcription factor jumonji aspartyl beta-hydroxylase [Fusarium mexicanum]|uniref:Transcription factor jumonji aspartyl beta-hydroxylase n=1 Tax=Fusarium mexicanum TaxID=751941 RepID=A0A8H5N6W2_9HYPO|nr:transcription factor jumonji aspartyl beta-hydroxylase [Fusarium mexicanum]